MKLLSLAVENVSVFRGRHHFDLGPVNEEAGGKRRPLTVVSGQNGAGKSTLFQAFGLALHGSLTLGDRVGQEAYRKFLLGRLHRGQDDPSSEASGEGSVTLAFGYVRSGRPVRVEVERRWRRAGRGVEETLSVLEDGSPPDVEEAEYQTWLNDFVPPGLAPLCFFDAERLDALGTPERHDALLRDIFGRLLGLDLVGRLQEDLKNYTLSRGGSRKVDRWRKEVLRHQTDIEVLKAQQEQLNTEADASDASRAEVEAVLAEQERRLASEGGGYAARRAALQERLGAVQREADDVSDRLRELCADLLPFALVPELCGALSERLTQEAEAHRQGVAGELWRRRLEDVEPSLRGEELWKGLDVPAEARDAVARRVAGLLRGAGDAFESNGRPLVHRLSEQEHARLQDWIARATGPVSEQARSLSRRLRELRAEQRVVEKDLQRAPDDDVLAPLRADIADLEAALEEAGHRRAQLTEKLGALRLQLEDRERQLRRAAEELTAAQADERRMRLAERSKRALRAYEDALTRRELAALEEELVAAFNKVSRKEHLLTEVLIDPDDLHVELRGANGRGLGLGDFSAGERQLYVMSLLWAMRRVSGRQLPLAVDTPLARLDQIHRSRLLHDYVPAVSEQVLLFATDAELDAGLLAEAEPYLSRVYRLEYDMRRGATSVHEVDQPDPPGVILYRGAANGDASSSNGDQSTQVWTTDFARVDADGDEPIKALLPKNAKRLVLFDAASEEHDWASVAELERLVEAPYVGTKLRAGATIGELWQDDWTRRLRQAGHDSLAVMGPEGPGEYVLDPSVLRVLEDGGPDQDGGQRP